MTLSRSRQTFTILLTWTFNFGLTRFISRWFLKKMTWLICIWLIVTFLADPWFDAVDEGVWARSQSILVYCVNWLWLLIFVAIIDNIALIIIGFQLIFAFNLFNVWSNIWVFSLFFQEKIAFLNVWQIVHKLFEF